MEASIDRIIYALDDYVDARISSHVSTDDPYGYASRDVGDAKKSVHEALLQFAKEVEQRTIQRCQGMIESN